MKVVLVQPRSAVPGSRMPLPPPLALAELGATLIAAGHDVRFVDADPAADGPGVSLDGADAVGIHAPSVHWPAVPALAARASAPTFVWGSHPTMFPEHALVPGVDAAVRGEPEDTVLAWLERLDGAGVAGLSYRDGDPVHNKPRPVRPDLAGLALPAWDRLPLERYALVGGGLPLRLGRGCSHAECLHCASSASLRRRFVRPEPREAADRVAELARRTGVRRIRFDDEELVVGGDWVRDFCIGLREHGNPVRWTCQARPSQLDHGLLRAMEEAACEQVLIGMDVLHTPTLHALHKDQSVAQCAAAVRDARHARVGAAALLVAGLPGTSAGLLEESVEQVLSWGVDVVDVVLYRPSPGTPGWEQVGDADAFVASLQQRERAVFVPEHYPDARAVERSFRRARRRLRTAPATWSNLARRTLVAPRHGVLLTRQLLGGGAYLGYGGMS